MQSATDQVEVVTQAVQAPPGDRVLDRAAAAQHLAITSNASAVVWIDNGEVWMVSADGREMRHAPIGDGANPAVFASIATSLLGELVATAPVAPPAAPPAPAIVIAPAPPVVDATAPALVAAAVVQPTGSTHPSPRFDISGGTFITSRGMTFRQDPPDVPVTPPSYPSAGFGGVSLQGSVFPRPEQPYGQDLTGPGVTFMVQKSTGAMISANDTVNDTYGHYELDYTAFELGAHYRHQMGQLLVDGMVNYGKSSWSLEGDFPSSIEIPNTSYQYVGVGGTLEYAVSERARFSLGARYMYMLSSGDINDESWYGSGTTTGLGFDIALKIPISRSLYLRATGEYRRFASSFNGDGNLSTSEMPSSLAVSQIVDSWFNVGGQLGYAF
ncbi:MAG TPA: hypothetical protein VGG28_18660 [Kofleriaceae bacterium]